MTDNSRVRVSIVGVVVVSLFAALLGRLWFLQVGSGEVYVQAAEQNSTRVVQTESARGRLLDARGLVLVDNDVVWAVTVSRDLSEETLKMVLGQLAEVIGGEATPDVLRERVEDPRSSPLKPAVVAVDVTEQARLAILEHQESFPGVGVTKLAVRRYPYGRAAAHVLGYVGEITGEELKQREGQGYEPGDTMGRSGVEHAYERDLRGSPRRETVEVDPAGRRVGDPLDVEAGEVGHDVQLTIDAGIQSLVEESLLQGIEVARTQRNEDVEERLEMLEAPAGAAVVLDVTDGSVVAMASYPDYDPTWFLGGIPQELYDLLTENEDQHQPLLNRATQGLYAPGSTFKLVTSIAAVEYGIRPPSEWIEDNGSVEIGEKVWHNAGNQAHGQVDLRRALTVSSDVYFYTLGRSFWQTWKYGDVATGEGIQATARRFGFGEPTGIELDEARGRVPDAEWKAEFVKTLYPDDEEKQRENAIWYPGDVVNLSVGQGDLVVTPLQLACAYAAFANGGTLWEPRLASRVVDRNGQVVREIEPSARRTIEIDPALRDAVLAGLFGTVADDEGTAAGAFAGFPLEQVPVAGKTGTAQVAEKGDTSLFAGFFPAHQPKYVVVALVEQGGFGARIAAPIVRRIIEGMNGLEKSTIRVWESGVD